MNNTQLKTNKILLTDSLPSNIERRVGIFQKITIPLLSIIIIVSFLAPNKGYLYEEKKVNLLITQQIKDESFLCGRWKRLPDNNTAAAGMEIEVLGNGYDLSGTIVSSPSPDFPELTVKWTSLTVGPNKTIHYYDLDSLGTFQPSTMKVNKSNRQLNITCEHFSRGEHQTWNKISN